MVQKFKWLGDSNDLIKKISSLRHSEEEEELVNETDDDEEGGEDEYDEDEGDYHRKKRKKRLMGRGAITKKRKQEVISDECDLHHALPNMENTLKNWTLHGQNLAKMVTNYHDQCRSMGKNNVLNWHIFLILLQTYWTQSVQ